MYAFIFYKLYKIAQKTEKKWNANARTPVTISIYSLLMLQFLNLLTIFALFTRGLKLIPSLTLTKETGLLSALFLYIINYLAFVRGKKYIEIETRYDNDTQSQKNFKTVLFWLYVVLTFVLFYTILYTYRTVK
ncbi:hypothetical protein AAON49_00690 [Pseudotenacibaculum sp. MALMAid0570]|uniref:hypothetical protein n=1 Tax=Pseudotenacibaculum sp. MALMAid0570 TaxID=3143938 RepID=UPI0032DE4C28